MEKRHRIEDKKKEEKKKMQGQMARGTSQCTVQRGGVYFTAKYGVYGIYTNTGTPSTPLYSRLFSLLSWWGGGCLQFCLGTDYGIHTQGTRETCGKGNSLLLTG